MKYNTQSISFNKERLNEDNASRNIFKQASWHGLEGILVATPVALTFSDLLRAAALGLRVGDTGRSNAANTISWKLIPANVRSAPLHPMASTKAWSMGPNSRAPQLIPQDAIAAAAARFVVKYSWTITKIGMISRPEPSPAKRKFKNNQRQAVFFFFRKSHSTELQCLVFTYKLPMYTCYGHVCLTPGRPQYMYIHQYIPK